MTSTAASAHQNRLAQETSPYLLQHQHNPVDWWPWNPAALAEAKRANKPILLSVGYAACHWCHVMAHESFEDDATAAVMNELFVNIKVDREERPDIDQIYMSALHLMGEHGGWPLTMFLTPAGRAVLGRHVFPEDRAATASRPSSTCCAKSRACSARSRRAIEQNRSALMERLSETATPQGKVVIGPAELDRAAQQLGGLIDPVHGGIRGAPKFPQCMLLEFLWRAGQRTGEQRYFAAVEITLERICQGGIYDHLGGGFSRYSVDERWLVPHFEKMLYDNAQLLELLALAHRRSGNPLFKTRAQETVDWLAREMTTEGGAFCASLDADFGRRGGQVLRLVARRDRARPRQGRRGVLRAALRRHRRGQFRGPHHPQPAGARSRDRRRRRRGSRHCAAGCSRCATSGCGPGSTTRCWRTGTA